MIEIKGVSKKFGEIEAVRGISLSVKKGEVLGFLGPNGAGKTTTMKLITGFWQPDRGEIVIDGLDSVEHSQRVRAKIGYLPETVPLYDEMKVYEYLHFIAGIRDIAPEMILGRLKEVVQICNLHSVIGKSLDELSKGYRQRVGLAQAIMHNPDILILDEPTTGLDPNQIAEIRQLIKEIGREKTVIFSTHILAEAQATCDRVVIINKGKIVAEGSPEELASHGANQEVISLKLQAPAEEALTVVRAVNGVEKVELVAGQGKLVNLEVQAKWQDEGLALGRALVERGWPVCELTRSKMSLEEVFRELTK